MQGGRLSSRGIEASLDVDVMVIQDAGVACDNIDCPPHRGATYTASLSPSQMDAKMMHVKADDERQEARFGPIESQDSPDAGESDDKCRRRISRRWNRRLSLLDSSLLESTQNRSRSISHAPPAWAVPKFAEKGLHFLTGKSVGKGLQISKRTNEFALILAKGTDVKTVHKALREEHGEPMFARVDE